MEERFTPVSLFAPAYCTEKMIFINCTLTIPFFFLLADYYVVNFFEDVNNNA